MQTRYIPSFKPISSLVVLPAKWLAFNTRVRISQVMSGDQSFSTTDHMTHWAAKLNLNVCQLVSGDQPFTTTDHMTHGAAKSNLNVCKLCLQHM